MRTSDGLCVHWNQFFGDRSSGALKFIKRHNLSPGTDNISISNSYYIDSIFIGILVIIFILSRSQAENSGKENLRLDTFSF